MNEHHMPFPELFGLDPDTRVDKQRLSDEQLKRFKELYDTKNSIEKFRFKKLVDARTRAKDHRL